MNVWNVPNNQSSELIKLSNYVGVRKFWQCGVFWTQNKESCDF